MTLRAVCTTFAPAFPPISTFFFASVPRTFAFFFGPKASLIHAHSLRRSKDAKSGLYLFYHPKTWILKIGRTRIAFHNQFSRHVPYVQIFLSVCSSYEFNPTNWQFFYLYFRLNEIIKCRLFNADVLNMDGQSLLYVKINEDTKIYEKVCVWLHVYQMHKFTWII